jgi:ubiquinone/menaquinone biosynthesis C-methylase UbiE
MLDYRGMKQQGDVPKIEENIADLLEFLKSDDTILDAGCGIADLYRRVGNYTGIDINPENITEARKTYPDADLRVGDIFKLADLWDVVWCSRVLLHLPNLEKNIDYLKSLARKYVFVLVPIGEESCEIEKVGDYRVEFRTYSRERIEKTHPSEIRMRKRYATVIYAG